MASGAAGRGKRWALPASSLPGCITVIIRPYRYAKYNIRITAIERSVVYLCLCVCVCVC